MERISLGHVSVDGYDARQLTECLLQRAFTSSDTNLVATLNAQLYVLSANDLAFCACLQRAEFLCADGKSISFASDWLAGKQIERVAGVDLIVDLCARGAGSGLRVYFLGGKPGAGQETAERLQARYKGLSVVGISSPPWGFEHDPQILSKLLAQIAEAKPQIIFVGLGAPKQEMFIDQHLRALHIPVAIGVGGSFEILSGQVQRAPIWMQQTGLEWLFRLLREPRRLWKRYCFGNFHFLWIVFMYYSQARIFALYHRFQRPAPAPGSLHDRK